jgi:hypothetical protein
MTATAVMHKAVSKVMAQYGNAFEVQELALKGAMSLVLAFVALGFAIMSPAVILPWYGWAAFVPVVTVATTIGLTIVHFVASVTVHAAVSLYTITTSFISGLFTKPVAA